MSRWLFCNQNNCRSIPILLRLQFKTDKLLSWQVWILVYVHDKEDSHSFVQSGGWLLEIPACPSHCMLPWPSTLCRLRFIKSKDIAVADIEQLLLFNLSLWWWNCLWKINIVGSIASYYLSLRNAVTDHSPRSLVVRCCFLWARFWHWSHLINPQLFCPTSVRGLVGVIWSRSLNLEFA